MEPEEPDFREDHYDTPNIFRAKVRVLGQDHPWEVVQQFVDVPADGWRSHTDQVFAVVDGELHAVEIQSAQDWYRPKLGPRESIRYPATNEFSDYQLEFSLWIWNADDSMASATAGSVTGTYQIIQQSEVAGRIGIASASGASTCGASTSGGQPNGSPPPVTTWKMAVVSAKRGPP